jgi:hypothetical protein
LLGYPQPYTYLFAYQDSEEIKATGGFIGSMALVTVEGGKVRQEFQGTDVRDNLSVPPPEPMQLYNRDFAWLFRDANWSPDFPTSAQLERYFLRLDFHRDVAGVVNLTPQAIGDVLAATGPVYSPEYGQWIRSDNVARLADYYAHWTNGWGGPQQFANADTRRKQFMQIVAQHILTKMSSLSPAQWIGLLKELSQAVGRRDILVYFTDPEAERLARLTGADGEINRTSSDYLYVVDTNFSYNKLSKYVHTAVTYNVRVRPDRWLDAHLTVSYRNVGAPASLERQGWWGPGAGRLGAWNDYASFLRIFVPAGAEILSQSGWYQPWTPGSAYGKTMFSGYVIVRAGRTSTVRLHYVVPPNVFNASHGREYRLTVQHQPGSLPGRWAISVAAGGKQILSRVVPHPVGDLTAAAAVQPGPYTPIPLTRDGSGVVAPGHVIEPHAYLRAPGP